MLKIEAEQVSKAYMKQWVIRDLSVTWQQGESYAITGHNGAGKSTLVALLMGLTLPTKGQLRYTLEGKALEPELWHRHLTLAAPYQELIEEFTLSELLKFHFQFKTLRGGLSHRQLLDRMYLYEARHKPIRYFSSGMKQRLRLALAFFSESQVLFLDEPTSNLDQRAQAWYQEQLAEVISDRLVIIASNVPQEYALCKQTLELSQNNT